MSGLGTSGVEPGSMLNVISALLMSCRAAFDRHFFTSRRNRQAPEWGCSENDLVAKVDAWGGKAGQRSEGLRRLVELGLKAKSRCPAHSGFASPG